MEATLRFELRQDKVNRRGEHPLILVIRVAGQRRKLGTGVTLQPELWDNENQKIISPTQKLKAQLKKSYGESIIPKSQLFQNQEELASLVNKIKTIEMKFSLEGISYSADMILEALKGSSNIKTKREDPSDLVYDFIDRYIQEHELTRVKGSLVVYKSLKKHLNKYQKKTKQIIQFSKIDYSFMQSFQNFLIGWKEVNKKTKGEKTLNNISIAKQLSTLKTFLGYAKRQGIMVNTWIYGLSHQKR